MTVSRIRIGIFETYVIDTDVLFLLENIIESYEAHVKDILKPLFDSVWNAYGYHRSLFLKGE